MALFFHTSLAQDASQNDAYELMYSQNCVNIVKRFEGFRSKAYLDGHTPLWTVGWGFTTIDGHPVTKDTVIDQETANRMLLKQLIPYNAFLLKTVKVPLNQNQEDALTCWVYNLGPGKWAASTALKKLNRGDYHGAIESASRWISPGTAVEKGLRARRQAEKALFLGQL